MEELLAYIIFILVSAGISFICYGVVHYYIDKHESEKLTTCTTIAAMIAALVCLMVIPVDIYSISQVKDDDGKTLMNVDDVDAMSSRVKTLYYIFFVIISLFIFIAIPFAYCFYEAMDEDTTNGQRAASACHYTVFFVLAMIAFMVIGLFIQKPTENERDKDQWKETVFDNEHKGDASIGLTLAVLSTVGMVCWLYYTAYGMSAFPIGLIRGKQSSNEESEDMRSQLNVAREQKRAVEAKYVGGKKMSKKDRKKLDTLKRQERLLSNKQRRFDESQNSVFNKILKALAPFRILFGILLTLLTVLIFISLVITTVDKQTNSLCGAKCGYVIDEPSYYNPLDKFFLALHSIFPLDYVLLFVAVIFIVMATISGAVRIGIRFLWVNMYSIRAHKTVPQALLMLVAFIMLILLALNVFFVSLAPQYLTFGSQHYLDAEANVVPCTITSITSDNSGCVMSQVSLLVNRITVKMPIFGAIFFYANYATMLIFLIGLFYSIAKDKASNLSGVSSDDSSDDDFL
eukprot:TRINITY_DN17115_c0_g1_i1.p1 TRINITY_DN17115_c0_g1~~TRINITY_DN17115_c0_g1_i1.p1  ORF type:complete len:516 (-),score=109.28 TRINITY_DN17115_c0_g1_i1:56-1603(-)